MCAFPQSRVAVRVHAAGAALYARAPPTPSDGPFRDAMCDAVTSAAESLELDEFVRACQTLFASVAASRAPAPVRLAQSALTLAVKVAASAELVERDPDNESATAQYSTTNDALGKTLAKLKAAMMAAV